MVSPGRRVLTGSRPREVLNLISFGRILLVMFRNTRKRCRGTLRLPGRIEPERAATRIALANLTQSRYGSAFAALQHVTSSRQACRCLNSRTFSTWPSLLPPSILANIAKVSPPLLPSLKIAERKRTQLIKLLTRKTHSSREYGLSVLASARQHRVLFGRNDRP